MTNSLIEISRENWCKLRDLYKEHKKEPSAYGLLQTIIKWIKKDPNLEIKIYSLNGDWEQDGTFLSLINGLQQRLICFNTLSNNSEHLTAALNCLNTKSEYIIYGFAERHKKAVKDHIEFAGYGSENFNHDQTIWYYIEKEKALQFQANPPADYTLQTLQKQHAEQINSIWPHRGPGSIKFVELLIENNESIGLFHKTGNLIAWCLRLPLGSLGLLHVIDTHKRQGFGNLVVRYMARLIASQNEEVMAPVVVTNVASRTMFEKLGFTAIDKANWFLRPSK